MDFADMLLNRFDGEAEMKIGKSALISFSTLETGKILSKLTTRIIQSKSEKSAITLLHFIGKLEEMGLNEEIDEYKHKIISDFLPAEEKDKITLRLFVQSTDNYCGDITKICEEQNSDLILIGIHHNELDPEVIKKYGQLKSDPTLSDIFILDQFEKNEAEILKDLNAIFSKNKVSTALFLDNGTTQFKKLFIPILQKSDIHLFPYIYQIAQQENVKIMIWDAIGMIESDAKIQKLYQFINKKTGGGIYLWDNNKKIECDFIHEQDLMIIGLGGWHKLICTPLSWRECLPSMLIIKETINPIQL